MREQHHALFCTVDAFLSQSANQGVRHFNVAAAQ